MADKDLKQMFMQRRPCMVLLAVQKLKKPYVSAVMKEADTTFAHTTNILTEMESYGLVRFVSEGRVKYVRLTPHGKRVARSMKTLDDMLDGKKLLTDIDAVQKRLDRLEDDIRSGPQDDKAIKRRVSRYERISAKVMSIESEALYYRSDLVSPPLRLLKERMGYLGDRARHGMRP